MSLNHLDCCQPEQRPADHLAVTAAKPGPAGRRRANGLKYYLLSFLTFFGLYAASSTCPFCGKPGCPVGVGGATMVGGACAFLWQYGRAAWERLTGWIREKGPPKVEEADVADQNRKL